MKPVSGLLGIEGWWFLFPFKVYGLKPEVWGRVVPDPWVELQVDPAQGLCTRVWYNPFLVFSE